jgi:hypothetical protein
VYQGDNHRLRHRRQFPERRSGGRFGRNWVRYFVTVQYSPFLQFDSLFHSRSFFLFDFSTSGIAKTNRKPARMFHNPDDDKVLARAMRHHRDHSNEKTLAKA